MIYSFLHQEYVSPYLTRSWACSASEFREIVGLQQQMQSFLPQLLEKEEESEIMAESSRRTDYQNTDSHLEDKIIEARNDVTQRTSMGRLAEWNATVHASKNRVKLGRSGWDEEVRMRQVCYLAACLRSPFITPLWLYTSFQSFRRSSAERY